MRKIHHHLRAIRRTHYKVCQISHLLLALGEFFSALEGGLFDLFFYCCSIIVVPIFPLLLSPALPTPISYIQSSSVVFDHVAFIHASWWPFPLLPPLAPSPPLVTVSLFFISISLIASDPEHPFIYLWTLHMSSLEKCLFRSFAHFLIDCLFFWCWVS